MEDQYAPFRKADGTIDWGAHAQAKFEAQTETAALPRKIIALEDLRIFTLANELSDRVWEIAARWPWFAKKTLGDQWVRATDSIAANIAEGYGRYFFGEYLVFLYYARGSLYESVFWTEKARKRELVTDREYAYLSERLTKLPKELNTVIKTVKEQQQKWKGKR